MKHLKILSIIILIILYSNRESIAQDNKPLIFEQVIQVDGVEKNILYDRIKKWIAISYVDANTVIKLDDKEIGELVVKGSIKYSRDKFINACATGYIDYTLQISVKDNKYKYQISQISHISTSTEMKGCYPYYSIGTIYFGNYPGDKKPINWFENNHALLKKHTMSSLKEITDKLKLAALGNTSSNW